VRFLDLPDEPEHPKRASVDAAVSHEQASKVIEYFRQKCGLHGQPLDS
jgi:hypothetical protein